MREENDVREQPTLLLPYYEQEHRKLRPKQDRFARIYIETGNAAEAYRRAYDVATMSARAIEVEAHRQLKHPGIKARIAELVADLQQRHEVTVDRIVAELAVIAFADGGRPADWCEAAGDVWVKLHSKLDALQRLAQQLGMRNQDIACKLAPRGLRNSSVYDRRAAARQRS